VCAFSGGRARSLVLGVRPSASIRLRCRVPGPRCQIRYLVPGTGHQVEYPSHASKNPHTGYARLVPSKPRGPRPILAGPPPPPPPGPRDHHLGIDASRPPPRVSTCGHPPPTPSLRATAVSADGTSGSPLQTPCHSGQKPLRSGNAPGRGSRSAVPRVYRSRQIVQPIRHPGPSWANLRSFHLYANCRTDWTPQTPPPWVRKAIFPMSRLGPIRRSRNGG